MWTKLISRGVGVLAFAFLLTSAAMFWLPPFERAYWQYIGSSYDLGYFGTSWGTTTWGTVQDLKKRSPMEERQVLDAISAELKEKTNAELYQMKAFADVCENSLVDCRGLASTKVKPFIDAILSDRQSAETALYSRAANFISAGSLFLSFVALIFTGLSYRRKQTNKA